MAMSTAPVVISTDYLRVLKEANWPLFFACNSALSFLFCSNLKLSAYWQETCLMNIDMFGMDWHRAVLYLNDVFDSF